MTQDRWRSPNSQTNRWRFLQIYPTFHRCALSATHVPMPGGDGTKAALWEDSTKTKTLVRLCLAVILIQPVVHGSAISDPRDGNAAVEALLRLSDAERTWRNSGGDPEPRQRPRRPGQPELVRVFAGSEAERKLHRHRLRGVALSTASCRCEGSICRTQWDTHPRLFACVRVRMCMCLCLRLYCYNKHGQINNGEDDPVLEGPTKV